MHGQNGVHPVEWHENGFVLGRKYVVPDGSCTGTDQGMASRKKPVIA
jgi:hypothetical protein